MIIASLLSANLCATSFGWPSIFYLFGGIGIIWIFAWFFLFTNHPSTNKWVSEEEKRYLAQHVTPPKQKVRVENKKRYKRNVSE